MIKRVFIIMLFLLSASPSFAEDIYIADSAAGGDTGANCANAHSKTWFNTAGNWGGGGGDIDPGDTVHLCGTFTGSAGASTLTTQGDGTAGNPITIIAESGAVLTSPWANEGHINAYTNQNSYLVIDGGTNGVIRNTQNGVGKTYQEYSAGIITRGGSNITIKNWTVENIFTRAQDDAGGNPWGVGIQTWYSSNILIENNHTDNGCFGVDIVYGSGGSAVDNIIIRDNELENFNIAVHVASAGDGATASNIVIDNNLIHDAVIWDDPSNDYHHNAVHAYAVQTGTSITNLTISNNYVSGAWSTAGHNTAVFFIEMSPGTATGVLVYNNLIAPSSYSGGNAFIYAKSGSAPLIYNNTIIGGGSVHGIEADGGATIKNNIFSTLDDYVSASSGSIVSDYNLFYGTGDAASAFNGGSFSTWQGAGYDANGVSGSDPSLDGSYIPQVGSPAINAGASLAGSFTTDRIGTSRPQGAAWDIGSMEFTSGSPPAPSSPVIRGVSMGPGVSFR